MVRTYFDFVAETIYSNRMQIGDYTFSDIGEYLDALYERAEFKGKVFWENIDLGFMVILIEDDHTNEKTVSGSAYARTKISEYNRLKIEDPSIIETPKRENKLPVPAVALLCWYSKRKITKNNAENIANEYGHISGDTLYGEYLRFEEKTERVNQATTSHVKIKALLGYFVSILPVLETLSPAGFDLASKEFGVLKRYHSKIYEKNFSTQ